MKRLTEMIGFLTSLTMAIVDQMREKLVQAFDPEELIVTDESARHAGHAGARPGGESHFDVRIVSRRFEGASRIERQRKVYAVLADELRQQVHALSLTTLTPAEAWQEH